MNANKEIIPAVLSESFNDIKNLADKAQGVSNWIQIDICDGSISPLVTWPNLNNGDIDESKTSDGLPHWKDINYEADLLLNNPVKYLDFIIDFGVSRCVIHPAFFSNETLEVCCKKLSDYDVDIGLGLKSSAEMEEIYSYVKSINEYTNNFYFQVMGIKEIGLQGQPFDKQSLGLIQNLKKHYPDTLVQVDGSVNDDTIYQLSDAGADRFIVGSWFKKKPVSISEGMQILNDLI